MESRLIDYIDAEVEYSKRGQPGHIIAKMNSLEDRHMIAKLYEASAAGVQIDLIVRGLCCLRPGVPGLSDNIQVISIIGRLLEHARIFYFRSGAEVPQAGTFFLSSADWMGRNLHRRVELAVPIREQHLRERLWSVLDAERRDTTLSWEMGPDGTYRRRTGLSDPLPCGSQEFLMLSANQFAAIQPEDR
jgi:polyphosphate kinase